MIVRGTWDWNLIKVETDSGLYGIGEAYWGWGVKDLVVNTIRRVPWERLRPPTPPPQCATSGFTNSRSGSTGGRTW